jgi:hypothetical protein
MVNFGLNEIIYIHKIISEQEIKGADAPFIAIILNKLVNEASVIERKKNEVKTQK